MERFSFLFPKSARERVTLFSSRVWLLHLQTRSVSSGGEHCIPVLCLMGFPGGSDDALPAMQETWFPSQGQEDPLKKELTAQLSILARRIPWTEEHGELQSRIGLKPLFSFMAV